MYTHFYYPTQIDEQIVTARSITTNPSLYKQIYLQLTDTLPVFKKHINGRLSPCLPVR